MANLRHYTVHRLRDFGSGDDDGISLTSFHTLEEAMASTPALLRASWRLLYKGSVTRSSSTDPIGETVSVPTWQSGSVDGWHYRISDDTEAVRLQTALSPFTAAGPVPSCDFASANRSR